MAQYDVKKMRLIIDIYLTILSAYKGEFTTAVNIHGRLLCRI